MAAPPPQPVDQRSDEDLMRSYVAGDGGAVQVLFRRYAGLVMGIGRRRGLSEADARDLLQQTFLQLHRARNDFRQGARLRPWLLTIAANLLRDQFRRRLARPTEPIGERDWASPDDDPARQAERRETRVSVRAAVAKLREGQRQVIELHWFEGLSFPEVADVLGVSVSAVKVRAHRGYQHLRDLLRASDPTEDAAARSRKERAPP